MDCAQSDTEGNPRTGGDDWHNDLTAGSNTGQPPRGRGRRQHQVPTIRAPETIPA